MSTNFAKMGTSSLRNAIAKGKFEGEELVAAQASLTKRESKPAAAKKEVAKAAPAKKEKAAPAKKEKVVKVKAEKAPKEPKAPKTLDDYAKDGVSGLVRKMLTPTDGTKIAGCSFGEAKKAVLAKFGRELYPSEFSRNFDILKTFGVVETKQPPRYKSTTEEKPAKKEKASAKKAEKKS